MDTLINDLFLTLVKHFDVLPVVFLTDISIELEDAERSVYHRKLWPWLLYDIKRSYKYVLINAMKNKDNLGILKCLDLDDKIHRFDYETIENIYIKAHRYNNPKIIKTTKKFWSNGYDECCLYNAALGGQLELFNNLLNINNHDASLVIDYATRFAYEGGHQCILETPYISNHLDVYHVSAILGAITGNHLDTLKSLIDRYGVDNITCKVMSYGPNTFDTVKYLIENKIIEPNMDDFPHMSKRMVRDNAPVKLFKWFVFDYWQGDRIDMRDIVIYCINHNSIHYIDNLIPPTHSRFEDKIKYLFEKYNLVIQFFGHDNLTKKTKKYRKILYVLNSIC